MRRFLSILLAALLLFLILPCGFAIADDDAVFFDTDTAGEYLKAAMVRREATVEISIHTTMKQIEEESNGDVKAYASYLVDEILEKVYEHTGVGCEGDFLRFSVLSNNCSIKCEYTDAECKVQMCFSFEYSSTYEQEVASQSMLEEIESEAGLKEKSDYEKVRYIYSYICSNVSYEYGEDVPANYSAYSALINGKAVCQGYATLLYRMLLDVGIDVRILSGLGNNASHVWNMIRLGDKYYLADCTWDEAVTDYKWFLKGLSDFTKHNLDERTSLLCAEYDISDDDYSGETSPVEVKNGDFAGTVYSGEVTITAYTGNGGDVIVPSEMNGYPVTAVGRLAFEGQQGIKNLTFSEGIKHFYGECLFESDVENIYLPSTLIFGENGVKGLGGCFVSCRNLKTIHVPDNSKYLTVQDNVLFSKDMKTLILFPAAKECSEYVIPDGVEEISGGAFCDCSSLTSVTIPDSATLIWARAFYNCESLKDVYYTGSEEPWEKINIGVENDCLTNAAIHFAKEPIHVHSYTAAVTAPTCIEKGYTTHTCACGDSYIDSEVPAPGHGYSYSVSVLPTEKESGILTGVCECGAEISITLPKLNKTDYTYNVIEAVTCISEGSAVYTWNNTQYGEFSFDVTLPKGSGDHKCTPVVVAPTCTEQGYTYYKCDLCERIIGDYTDYLPALGHDYADGVCTVCGAKDPDYKPPVKENPFTDVSETAVYYDAVIWASENEITSGYGNNDFRPQNPCTRAQVVTFLWRAAGCPEPTGDTSIFKDAASIAAPFQKAVAWAVEKGITAGFNDGTFRPNDAVTRAQFVTFLWRYEGQPATTGSINGFADAASIAAPYQSAVAWAVEKGITTGYNDNTFRPNDVCTRWAVVLFMFRDMA